MPSEQHFYQLFQIFRVKGNFAIKIGLKVLFCRFGRVDLQNKRKDLYYHFR